MRLGLDGGDGAGKTTLADALGAVLRARGVPVLRASADDFHHVAAVRHHDRTWRGYWESSYDLASLRTLLLEPLGPSGDGTVVAKVHDLATDAVLDPDPVAVAPGTVLLLDGVFLQRPELAGALDVVVWVEASAATRYARMAVRDGCPPDPDDPANARYRAAHEHYRVTCDPVTRADHLLVND